MTELGRITSVFPDQDDNRLYVSVKVSPSEFYEEILFTTGSVGLWMVPNEGDIVEVYNVGRERYHARTPTNPTPFSMPNAGEGDFCLRLNQNTELYFNKQGDDTFDLTIETDGDISITATDNVTVDAPTVKLGGDTGTEVVARKGDTVETTDPLTGTETGTITSGASNTEAK